MTLKRKEGNVEGATWTRRSGRPRENGEPRPRVARGRERRRCTRDVPFVIDFFWAERAKGQAKRQAQRQGRRGMLFGGFDRGRRAPAPSAASGGTGEGGTQPSPPPPVTQEATPPPLDNAELEGAATTSASAPASAPLVHSVAAFVLPLSEAADDRVAQRAGALPLAARQGRRARGRRAAPASPRGAEAPLEAVAGPKEFPAMSDGLTYVRGLIVDAGRITGALARQGSHGFGGKSPHYKFPLPFAGSNAILPSEFATSTDKSCVFLPGRKWLTVVSNVRIHCAVWGRVARKGTYGNAGPQLRMPPGVFVTMVKASTQERVPVVALYDGKTFTLHHPDSLAGLSFTSEGRHDASTLALKAAWDALGYTPACPNDCSGYMYWHAVAVLRTHYHEICEQYLSNVKDSHTSRRILAVIDDTDLDVTSILPVDEGGGGGNTPAAPLVAPTGMPALASPTEVPVPEAHSSASLGHVVRAVSLGDSGPPVRAVSLGDSGPPVRAVSLGDSGGLVRAVSPGAGGATAMVNAALAAAAAASTIATNATRAVARASPPGTPGLIAATAATPAPRRIRPRASVQANLFGFDSPFPSMMQAMGQLEPAGPSAASASSPAA